MSMAKTETYSSGDPLEYITKGVEEISSTKKSRYNTLVAPIEQTYGITVDDETANVIDRIDSAIDPVKLINAMKSAELTEVEDYSTLFAGEYINKSGETKEPDLGRVMQVMDRKLSNSLVSREGDVSQYTSKNNRDDVYIPDIVLNSEGGTVYMAKTLTSATKVRIAHDLNENNTVIVVDDYDRWEKMFGWKKLKSLPHGKNKIRAELGHRLSDEVLDTVASGSMADSVTNDTNTSSSKSRRTRTAPTDEVLNVARGSAHSQRKKYKSKKITEEFDDNGKLDSNVQMLVLFPTTTDLNMSDHWWVAGSRWSDGGSVAIANCNKGTFEYLNQCDEVWHIEDYLEQSWSHTINSNVGQVTCDAIDSPERLVLHVVPEDTKRRFNKSTVIENVPEILPEYVNKHTYSSVSLPHPDEMLYTPITKETLFWLRPAVREMQPEVTVLYGTSSPRDVINSKSISSDYKLYARARLPDWDFNATELQSLDSASYRISLDDGGYELVETMGKLHDAGMKPFSQTPEARWE